MFRALHNAWLRRRRRKLRDVFRFFDGKQIRAVDPFMVYRALDSHPRFKWDHLPMTDEGDVAATDLVVSAAREVFGIPPYEEGVDSLTAAEVLDVLASFGEWIESQKKTFDRGLTSSPPAAGTPSTTTEDPRSTTHLSAASR